MPAVHEGADPSRFVPIGRGAAAVATLVLAVFGTIAVALVWGGLGDLENLLLIVFVEVAAVSGWIIS